MALDVVGSNVVGFAVVRFVVVDFVVVGDIVVGLDVVGLVVSCSETVVAADVGSDVGGWVVVDPTVVS